MVCRTPCNAFILNNEENLRDQINERTNEESGQHQNGIHTLRFSQHLQQSENTDKDTSSCNLPEGQGHIKNRVIHLDESMLQPMHQQDPQQNISENIIFQFKEYLQNAIQSVLSLAGGHNPQLSEKCAGHNADCSMERKTPSSSPRHLSYQSIFGEENTEVDISVPVPLLEDRLSDNGKDDINIPLLKQSSNFGNAHAARADYSSRFQIPVRKTRQKSDSHSDERGSLLSTPTTDAADTDMASLLPEDRTLKNEADGNHTLLLKQALATAANADNSRLSDFPADLHDSQVQRPFCDTSDISVHMFGRELNRKSSHENINSVKESNGSKCDVKSINGNRQKSYSIKI